MTTQHERLCAWCGEPVQRKSANGPRPTYCKQGCRQRAYEARRTEDEINRAVQAAVQAALLAAGASLGPDPSRDRTEGQPPPPVPSSDGSGALLDPSLDGKPDEPAPAPPAAPPPPAPRRPALPTTTGRRDGSPGRILPLWPRRGGSTRDRD